MSLCIHTIPTLTLFYPGLVYVEVLTINKDRFKTNVHLGSQALAKVVPDTFITWVAVAVGVASMGIWYKHD
jgi:hypothetical protein